MNFSYVDGAERGIVGGQKKNFREKGWRIIPLHTKAFFSFPFNPPLVLCTVPDDTAVYYGSEGSHLCQRKDVAMDIDQEL